MPRERERERRRGTSLYQRRNSYLKLLRPDLLIRIFVDMLCQSIGTPEQLGGESKDVPAKKDK